ncbi:hypothetical protein [Sporosarcina sp. FSL K6-5500]|uniref:hypothetical protein n=1 Tax=Sporosarcina sp. FSL K6-5500 TaxID=2921558 RepID=UPI0030F9A149
MNERETLIRIWSNKNSFEEELRELGGTIEKIQEISIALAAISEGKQKILKQREKRTYHHYVPLRLDDGLVPFLSLLSSKLLLEAEYLSSSHDEILSMRNAERKIVDECLFKEIQDI